MSRSLDRRVPFLFLRFFKLFSGGVVASITGMTCWPAAAILGLPLAADEKCVMGELMTLTLCFDIYIFSSSHT